MGKSRNSKVKNVLRGTELFFQELWMTNEEYGNRGIWEYGRQRD
jgi:hypothetical protein